MAVIFFYYICGMKKLIPLLFLFGCSPDPIPETCTCFREIIYWNNGTELYLVEKDTMPQNKCDLWQFGENYIPFENNQFEYRFICE